MDQNPIYVTKPMLPDLDDVTERMREIWESGSVTNNGKNLVKLEQNICRKLSVPHCVIYNNGTIALLAALSVLSDNEKNEIITTPFTFAATAHIIKFLGLMPVFVDIDHKTLTLDPMKVKLKLGPRTRAIMPVHCFDIPCDVRSFQDISKEHNVPIIYDAAHSFGSTIKGQSTLEHGLMSVCSFHATKVFSTIEGGCVVTKDENLAQKLREFRNFGILNEDDISSIGLNGKMSELHAIIGNLNLEKIDDEIEKRRWVAQVYHEQLRNIKGLSLLKKPNCMRTNFSYFPVLFSNKDVRQIVIEKLNFENIFPRRYFHPVLNETEAYRDFNAITPNASELAKRVLCLPIYGRLEIESLTRICNVIKDCLL